MHATAARTQLVEPAVRPASPFTGRPPANVAYATSCGRMLHGKSDEILADGSLARFEGKVNLIFTSPPFPLNRKKRYGNETGEAYIKWLCAFGPLFKKMLAPDGSIVVEMGNSWEPGMPVMSTLALRALLEFQEKNDLHLCQEFIWHNPARLPSPAQWVNVERSRVKDSFTKLWWMAPTAKPKASNQRVLKEYSKAMKTLLKRGTYNAGKRPLSTTSAKQPFCVTTAAPSLRMFLPTRTHKTATPTKPTAARTNCRYIRRACLRIWRSSSSSF